MRHQSEEEEKREKRRKRPVQTGSEEVNLPDGDVYDEIDPADFFDPEDFGFRRKFDSSRQ
jgi:hypothetical protein